MRLLLAHNFYQQPGGEDVVFEAEVALLRHREHEVLEYTDQNARLEGMGRLSAAAAMVWSRRSYRKLLTELRRYSPQVAHFHNTFLRISPSAYYACREAGVPVVQTLHNYRLLCPAATLLRDGRVCEDCVGKVVPWPGVWHACYRGSRAQTAGVAVMLTVHRWLSTWVRQVDVYVALTEFARRKFVEAGLPRERVVVKPNFVHPDPGPRLGEGGYALFVGRLSPEKGLDVLLDSWQRLSIPLKVAGDGPLMKEAQARVRRATMGHVELLGHRPQEEILALMKGARFLVFPSLWYEGFPIVVATAFACGVPVIGSRLGAVEEIVEDGRTGVHFTPGDAEDLVAKADWAWIHGGSMREMGEAARREYEEKYTADRNYKMLMGIYEQAVAHKRFDA